MGKEVFDFAIIDSGLNEEYKTLDNNLHCGIGIICRDDNAFDVVGQYDDEVGHGTAVFSIIRRENPEAKILVVKIFGAEQESTAESLIYALNYIRKKYQVHVVNISNGVEYCDNLEGLEKACNSLVDDGSILVAAFSNGGAISYPAAFEKVIGVDISLSCKHIHDFEYVENSPIDIRAAGITQRLPWINSKMARVSGTSFSCPLISSYIYKKYIKRGLYGLCQIKKHLRLDAKRYIASEKKEKKQNGRVEINKAILFPFNKEIHSLVKYQELTTFEIVGVYEVKNIGNCGKKTSEIIGQVPIDYTITDYHQINWNDDFDTIIIGHTRELNQVMSNDVRTEVVERALKEKKQIVVFDDIREFFLEDYRNRRIYTPIIDDQDVPENTFGKLYKIGKPILYVTGTSTKQGKYSLQLYLRSRFIKDGYRVGSLGTEPTSELLGCDEIYPMGYDSTAYVDGFNEISLVNYMLHRIERKNPDIIITGSQSQTVAYEYGNLRYIPIHQNAFMYACDADAYILVCNYYDEDEYISKTIAGINSFTYPEKNIIAIALFPEQADLQWSCLTNKKKFATKEESFDKAREIEKKRGIPTYVLGYENEKIYNRCLEYFQYCDGEEE